MNHERNCLEEMRTVGTQESNFSLNEQIANIKAEVLQTNNCMYKHIFIL